MQTTIPLYGFGGGSGETGAALTVTAPVGVTVTISKDGKTKTKVADASGIAVFKGLESGTWTVTIADGVQTSAPKTVTITADYSTAISFFAATINVTYPEGSTCTASDGVTTLAAPDTSGTWECVVPNAGDWVISLDSGFRETVSITQDGQTETLNQWHLYNLGDKHSEVTGGWEVGKYGNWEYKNFVTETDGSIVIAVSNNSGSGACEYHSKNKIDFTNVKELSINVVDMVQTENTNYCLYIESNSGLGNYNAPAKLNIVGAGYKNLDVSNITGEYFVCIGCWGGSGVAIRMEFDEVLIKWQ